VRRVYHSLLAGPLCRRRCPLSARGRVGGGDALAYGWCSPVC